MTAKTETPTPRTDALWDSYRRGACGPVVIRQQMEMLETGLNSALKELTACRAKLAEAQKRCSELASDNVRLEGCWKFHASDADRCFARAKELEAKLAASESARDQAIKALAEEGRLRGEAETERNKTMELLSDARAIIAAQGQRLVAAERECQRLREALKPMADRAGFEGHSGSASNWHSIAAWYANRAMEALAAGGEK